MDTDNITKIIDIMTEADLTELEIEQEGLKLRIRKGSRTQIESAMTTMASIRHSAHQTPSPPAEIQVDTNIDCIKSPMVGTFYEASSPETPSFVNSGDKVKADSVVCIIEAMKVMNEIHAEMSGSIVEVMVQNGQTVEYGQPLFRIKKTKLHQA